jgi:POT family proton-dependent oligopeptide transporter
MSNESTSAAPPQPHQKTFFGHPRGLATLFFTEMWERFSYYGMRALLILFMTEKVTQGGLELDAVQAGAIYALYTSLVYLLGLPGGWIADRFLGQRRAVLIGGITIAIGQFTLAVPNNVTFFVGLGVIIIGTGLLKPNVSAIVGQIYAVDDERRDAGFSIFYMGINIGAFAAPLICGYLGEEIDWHLGFAVAGVGMTLGLIQYVFGGKYLGEAGLHPVKPANEQEAASQRLRLVLALVAAGLLAVAGVVLHTTGIVTLTIVGLADSFGVLLLVLTVVFFAWLLLGSDWDPVERKRLIAIMVLFLAASFFWAGYEQAGSSFNLFAKDFTNRMIGAFEYPASWFQQVPALFVILQAPIFAWLWIRMGKRQPSSPTKFALGLIFVALGFAVMVIAATLSSSGVKVGPQWLLATYFLHVIGEMCLSPVGLSTVTKLAPSKVTGLMMGVWFLAAAVGNYLGGRAAGFYGSIPESQLFGTVAVIIAVGGLILLALVKPIRKLMGGVH